MSALPFPTERRELQLAVNAASALLAIHSAREYGLLSGGPPADVAQCRRMLEHGQELGVTPTRRAIEEYVAGLARQKARR